MSVSAGEPWAPFGSHADLDLCPYEGPLDFADLAEDYLPMGERHADGSECPVARKAEA